MQRTSGAATTGMETGVACEPLPEDDRVARRQRVDLAADLDDILADGDDTLLALVVTK